MAVTVSGDCLPRERLKEGADGAKLPARERNRALALEKVPRAETSEPTRRRGSGPRRRAAAGAEPRANRGCVVRLIRRLGQRGGMGGGRRGRTSDSPTV